MHQQLPGGKRRVFGLLIRQGLFFQEFRAGSGRGDDAVMFFEQFIHVLAEKNLQRGIKVFFFIPEMRPHERVDFPQDFARPGDVFLFQGICVASV